jgi:hypothetical protein
LVWNDHDWKQVEEIRLKYANGRGMEIMSLPDNGEWDSLVALVRNATNNLIQATERCNFSAEQVWTLVGGDRDQPNLQKESLRALMYALMCRLNRANAVQTDIAAKTSVAIGDAWLRFISRLDDQWRRKGLKATVRKGEGRPSAFVRWVALNLYMRRFVLGWKMLGLEQSLGSRIVTHADDLVILCRRGRAEEVPALGTSVPRVYSTTERPDRRSFYLASDEIASPLRSDRSPGWSRTLGRRHPAKAFRRSARRGW